MRLMVMLLLGAGTPAFAADQFDLACHGTRISTRGAPAEPYAFRVRIDLAARKWCTDACERLADISEVKPDRIVLTDDLIYNTSSDFSNAVSVDRTSYDFHQLSSQDRPIYKYLKVDAACTLQPFGGLPAAKS